LRNDSRWGEDEIQKLKCVVTVPKAAYYVTQGIAQIDTTDFDIGDYRQANFKALLESFRNAIGESPSVSNMP